MNLARRMLAAGLLGRTNDEGVEEAGGAMPSREDLMNLDYVLDGEPFVYIAASSGDETHTLGYSLDGQPFIGAA